MATCMLILSLVAIVLAFGLGYSQSELDRIKNPGGPEMKTQRKTKDTIAPARLLDV